MSSRVPQRVGRPAAATRDDALKLALAHYLQGRRIDVRALAGELGIGRTTVHRWFGTREDLIGDVLAVAAVELLEATRREVGGHGGSALLETFDRFNRALLAVPALRTFIAGERDALRVITRADHGPNPSLVRSIASMITDEVAHGHFVAPLEAETLAFAIVRLAEAFLYGEPATGMRQDIDRLRQVEAIILGVTP
ncbi:MAG: QsdR family transcriptional regulator [Nocardioides sp.]